MRLAYLVLFLSCFIVHIIGEEKIDLEKAVKDLGSDNYEIRLKAKKDIESMGLRAIPVLRKAINADDLETKDYAEKKVAESVFYTNEAYMPESILGSDAKINSTQKYTNEYYLYLKELILSGYEKNSKKNPKWDVQIKNLIALWVDAHKTLDFDTENTDIYHLNKGFRKNEMEIRKVINELTELNCDDLLFQFLKCSSYFAYSDYRFSIDELVVISDKLKKNNYSNYFNFFTSIRVKSIKQKPRSNSDAQETSPLVLDCLNQWIELGNEEAFKTPIGQRRTQMWFANFLDELQLADFEKNLIKISEVYGAESWIMHMVKTRFFIKKAWFHRGNNYANDVTDEGWKLFRANMADAETHLKAAIQLLPNYPEPYILMIQIGMTLRNADRIRLWFEKATKIEINNAFAYSTYIWALTPRNGGSVEEMLSLGREYLMINNPQINTAKFYMFSLRNVINEGGDISHIPGVLNEVEWAVEQQIACKSVYPFMYNNDLAIAAYKVNDFSKTLKAIKDTKGLYSTGWFDGPLESTYIEKLVTNIDKYKTKKTGLALASMGLNLKENFAGNQKIVIENLTIEIEPIDQAKVVSLLMSLNSFNNQENYESLVDLLYSYGYREVGLTAFMNLSQGGISEKLKQKMIERYGVKTMLAVDLAIKSSSFGAGGRKELADKIKEVFMKDVSNESELEKNDEYNKAQIRGCIFLGKNEKENQDYKKLISANVKKLQNVGDGGDFLGAWVFATKKSSFANSLGDVYKNYFFNPYDEHSAVIEQEMKKLVAIEDNQKLMEEVNKTWISSGRPLMMFEIINLLQQRKLDVEADKIRNWLFYTFEAFGYVGRDEELFQVLSLYPGYNKEAFQVGIRVARPGTCNEMNYLLAYHIFKLGHYHMAYEYLVKGQLMKDHGDAVIFNKKKYPKADDLLKQIVNEMLEDKALPEYIRYNLKDQFDVKFKK